MKQFDFKGVGVAVVTPFNSDLSIDYPSLENLVNSIIEGGCSYIVALGTTGETPTLTHEEKKNIADFIVDRVAGRVPVVLGCGGNNTADIVSFLHTHDLSRFAAILSVVPPYNKPSQEGLFAHFSAIAQASSIPVILYNIPGRAGVNMLPNTIIRLANANNNIIAVKEASGNLDQAAMIIAKAPEHFSVISGDDSLTLSMMAIGAKGVISVIANAYPHEWSETIKLALNDNYNEAKKILIKYLPMLHLLFAEGNPAGIKALLSAQGKIKNYLRLPLTPVSDQTFDAISKIMD